MTCVIGKTCVDVVDRAWVEKCSTDCIYVPGQDSGVGPLEADIPLVAGMRTYER